MAVYLFDEKRWYEDEPEAYADFLHGAVTDLIVLVYGAWQGGAMGWKSRYIDSMSGISDTRLLDVIAAMHSRNIRVHAAFNVCIVNSKSGFKPHRLGSKFVDVHKPEFHAYIASLMAECAKLPVDGICIDYCRTDDFRDADKNDRSLASLVKLIYENVKYVNRDCVVSSATTPYLDLTHPELKKTGRKAIHWANNGFQDLLFDMNYGNLKGKHGDAPDMSTVYNARKLTNTPIIVMVSSYKNGAKGVPFPTDAEQFSRVIDSVYSEDDVAIYTGWLFTEDQALLTSQMFG